MQGTQPSAISAPTSKSRFELAPQIRLILAESGVLTATANQIPLTLKSDPTSASFFKPDTDYPSLYGSPILIILDSEPTPSSRFTRTKTTNRAVYDAARARHGIASLPPAQLETFSYLPKPDPPVPGDVLLYNPQGNITETSVYNVAFYRANRWLTPPESSGCLPGVLRRWLLEQGRIAEAADGLLTRESIIDGECVLLMNGVRGCQLGRIVIAQPEDARQAPEPEGGGAQDAR
ncbi:hypothetical protein HWV62_20932 [Athelia sp. TMB]|nr:hypothetical protein HWV62_20932 [Athelia sp. TMB]